MRSRSHTQLFYGLFSVAIFLSAFQLFQVQPLLSKYILPWFGGTPSVWTTCMLFFQTLLFAGYAYAHLLSRKLSLRTQVTVHVTLLVIALLWLPISPGDNWKPNGDEQPVPRIIQLLTATVGLPFFLLSATGPLLQSWFSKSAPTVSVYRLYALSNVGSLLALLSYPFVFEPLLSSELQAGLWSWGFGAFVALCGSCGATMLWRNALIETPKQDASTNSAAEPAPTTGARLLWFSLAMAASVMLLATTNQVCMDVASVPFLWVMPLTLYLITFILTFDSDKWYSRKWFSIASAVSIAAVCVAMFKGAGGSIIDQIVIYFAGLFFTTMVCHGELVRLKPSSAYLTEFYLILSAGGAAGGLFVGMLAPIIFPTYLEMNFALFGIWVLALIVFFRDRSCLLYAGRPRWAWGLMTIGAILLGGTLRIQAGLSLDEALDVRRNFYGVLRLVEHHRGNPKQHQLRLMHGHIMHGLQFQSDEHRLEPTAYYGRESGVGLLLDHPSEQPRHVGVVGLGIGTVATFAQPDDRFRFYEINADVLRMAEEHFTFLSACRGEVTHIVADGRLALEREDDQNFDVLIVDAFSGDAIPVHLLTREAFAIYHRHLKSEGVLAIHISNLYFDLQPVVAAAADHFGWQVRTIQSAGDDAAGTQPAIWMLLAEDFRQAKLNAVLEHGEAYDGPRVEWTDTFSNLVEILR